MRVRLISEPLAPGVLLDGFCQGREESGAVVSFTGLCRGDQGRVVSLELDAYEGLAEALIEQTAEAALARFSLDEILIVHRIGKIAPGEAIVFVAAAAAHRQAAFEAAQFLMDYLKSRAPFWKKSHEQGQARWIEPTAQDYEQAARWDEMEVK